MELLKKLTSCVSPSGRESLIREIIKNELTGISDEIYTDTLGNLICHKKGNGKKLMLTAHMDEIGFIVKYIDCDGFIRFSGVGGIKKYNCINSPIKFENGINGKISYEDKEPLSEIVLDKMYIDAGFSSQEDAEKSIHIGDFASYAPSFSLIGNRIMSKALDDRAGCWAVIRAMQHGTQSGNDIYCVFTAQEEVGLRGAKTAAALINPDMAIAIDVSHASDTPQSDSQILKLSKGPAIKIKDKSFIMHESVKMFLLDCAKKSDIPYQIEVASQGGTDAGAIHISGSGIASGTISVPARYIHSCSEVVDRDDLENTVKFISEILLTPIEDYLF